MSSDSGRKNGLVSRLDGKPIETSLEEIQEEFQSSGSVLVWKFSKLDNGETLSEHVNQQMKRPEGCMGPFAEATLVYKSPQFIIQPIRDSSIEKARDWMQASWRNVSAYQKEWNAIAKSLSAGIFTPLESRGVVFGSEEASESRGIEYSHYPLILNEPDGQWWGMMSRSRWMDHTDLIKGSLRDLLTSKHSSSITSIVTVAEGTMLWQNASSMELYGCHNNSAINFLDLMFGPDVGSESIQAQMRAVTSKGHVFRVTVDVNCNPALCSLVRLTEGQELHLDCQVTQTQDPISLKKVFIISQSNVTETVVTQRRLELAQQKLETERAKLDAMMLRQDDLIECLRWVSEVGRTAGTKARAAQLIDVVKRQLTGASNAVIGEADVNTLGSPHHLDTNEFLGQGGFGHVVRGQWQDLTVAVKKMTLPSQLSKTDRRKVMALMELAISSSLLHTNIVKTHSYSVRPIREALAFPADAATSSNDSATRSTASFSQRSPSSFEIQIIMEYCDIGSLRAVFRTFSKCGQSVDYKVILELALDVANGMLHLHRNNIIHADLKPANVLLKSSPETPKGFIAKISDFGLSLSKDDALSSEVVGFRNGTKSHMAPEILSGRGSHSNASDVYSFGILLSELYNGIDAYSNTDAIDANFDQLVVDRHLRPTLPSDAPARYKDLAAACWNENRLARPSFETIVLTLKELREAEAGVTGRVEFDSLLSATMPEALEVNNPASIASKSSRDSSSDPLPYESPLLQRDPTTNDREFWERFFGNC